MQPLGAGLVYWPALAPLFESGDAAVLELEPQTLWTKTAASSGFAYRQNDALLDAVAALPQPKLLHGVGQPVAGSLDDPVDYRLLLRHTARVLAPAWISEHLSFNRVRRGDGVAECGFLLPPAQTHAAVRVAAANIGRYAAAMDCPVAFETGVNYLRPSAGGLDDGAFFAAVAQSADCGVLLDLHNLFCNERNGRQRMRDAIAQLPLERVWELHFAGGTRLNGMWLDAHSDAIPPELLEFAAELLPRLTNVGALIFEILPEHLPRIGLDGVQRQLEALRALWSQRPARRIRMNAAAHVAPPPSSADIAEVDAWERHLMDALEGETASGPLAADPGCEILRRLIRDARSASIARGLRYTITALLAGAGAEATTALVDAYCRSTPPDAYVALECHRFADHLRARPELIASVRYLDQVLAFERAVLVARVFGERTEVRWTVEPTRLLDALEQGFLPADLPPAASRMIISA